MLRTQFETLKHILNPKYYTLMITEEEMLAQVNARLRSFPGL